MSEETGTRLLLEPSESDEDSAVFVVLSCCRYGLTPHTTSE